MHTQILTLALAVEIILGILVFFALVVFVVSKFSFDAADPDMYLYDSYGEENRPFVALKDDCPHDGEKTDVVVRVTCTCEEIHTHCDDCGENLGIRMDC